MILLLDNKDSFVWNLAQALMGLGAAVDVVRSDRIAADDARFQQAKAVVLSPGPGRPEQAGSCVEAIRRHSGARPILGVCLGHQAIAQAFGADVQRAAPCHGRTSPVLHEGTGLYDGVPIGAPFCRYHSLQAKAPLPAPLRLSAWLADGSVMGLRHERHPTFGVQFHPESFRSPHGLRLLQNFLAVVA